MYRLLFLFSYLTYNLAISLLGATLLRNSIITFYLLHWAACGFFFIARQGSFGPQTWIGANAAPPAADGSSSGGVL